MFHCRLYYVPSCLLQKPKADDNELLLFVLSSILQHATFVLVMVYGGAVKRKEKREGRIGQGIGWTKEVLVYIYFTFF